MCVSHSVLSDSMQTHLLQPARLLCSWDSPGKNTGVDSHSLLQGMLTTQGSNLGPLHCRQILLPSEPPGKPCKSCQFSSVPQSCLTLYNPMDCSTPGLPVHHQLPEFTQTHVLWVSDAIQPSHRLSSPSPPSFDLSQHQSLFKWVSSSHQVAKVLEF